MLGKDKSLRKQGMGTIMAIVLITMLLPLMLFLSVDVPHFIHMDRKLQNIANQISRSAVALVQVIDGELYFDEDKVTEFITEEFINQFNLVFDAEQGVYLTKDGYFQVFTKPVQLHKIDEQIPTMINPSYTVIEYFIHPNTNSTFYIFSNEALVDTDKMSVGISISGYVRAPFINVPMKVYKMAYADVELDLSQEITDNSSAAEVGNEDHGSEESKKQETMNGSESKSLESE